jgi:threonine dehydrogenase-like Zn-dependent dehydrogenase
LVRVKLAAICNTDREIMRGYVPGFNNVLGHEFTGVVESLGEGTDPELAQIWTGQRVVGELNLNCGLPTCVMCGKGRPSQCQARKVLGIHDKDGCFADYLTLPLRLLHRIPEGMPDEVAIFTEPLAAALRITENTHVSPDEPVALLGDGRLAYMIGQVLALTGAPLTVFGLSAEKLAMFETFAVRTVLLASDNRGSPLSGVDALKAQDVQGFEVVADATGHRSGLATAIALTRSGGCLIMKSTYAETVEINMSEIVVREITIRGNRCGPFEPALRYLDRGLIRMPDIEFFSPIDFEAAFASDAFKAAIRFS